MKNIHKINQNIYITNSEEIKEGDWWLNLKTNDVDKCTHRSEVLVFNSEKYQHIKKIILTTDVDLIKDGVQAIKDEFLEWFVKNPSCEEVEVESGLFFHDEGADIRYKIIIPKEEPKQEYCEKCDCLVCECWEEPKQETLEEAKIEYHFENDIEMFEFMNEMASTGKIPKKWSLFVSKINDLYRQQERMYSEEELLQILESHKDNLEFDKDRFEHDRWFEQFKKK